MARVVKINSVVRRIVWASRGIATGSGFATTEMLLAMYLVVMAAQKSNPAMTPISFVDDLAVQASGTLDIIEQDFDGFPRKSGQKKLRRIA